MSLKVLLGFRDPGLSDQLSAATMTTVYMPKERVTADLAAEIGERSLSLFSLSLPSVSSLCLFPLSLPSVSSLCLFPLSLLSEENSHFIGTHVVPHILASNQKPSTVEPLIMDTLKSGQPPYNGQTVHPLPIYCSTSEEGTTSEQWTKYSSPKCPLFRGSTVFRTYF